MKKLLTIMVLALALCLVCGVALAADYANAKFESVAEFEAAITGAIPVGAKNTVIVTSNLEDVKADCAHGEYASVKAYSAPDADGKRIEVLCLVKVHSWVRNASADKAATCTKLGTIAYKCSVAGCKETKTEEAPLKEHAYVAVIDEAPICGKNGLMHEECSVCHAINPLTVDTVILPAHAAHSYALGYYVLKAPTCKADHSLNSAVKIPVCEYCNFQNVDAKTNVNAAGDSDAKKIADYKTANDNAKCKNKVGISSDFDGHNWDAWVDGEVSCSIGTNQKRWCKDCALIQEKELDATKRLKPQWEAVDLTKVVCTTNDFDIQCSVCKGKAPGHKSTFLTQGGVWADIENPAYNLSKNADTNKYIQWKGTVKNAAGTTFTFYANHYFKDPEIDGSRTAYPAAPLAAHCTTPLYAQFTCSICGHKLARQVAPALGHEWGEWEVKESGSNTETKVWQKTCKVCKTIVVKSSATKPIDKCEDGKHDYVIDANAKPNCGKTEKVKFICSICGDEKTEKYTWEHKKTELYNKPATCKEDGKLIEKCEYCGLSFETVLKKEDVEHTPGDPIVTPATLEKEGSEVVKCSVCGETLSTKVLPKLVAEAKYEVKDAVYDGKAVSGKVEHVKDTQELTAAYARVTFFYADGTFAVMVVPVEDGEFYAGATTATVHVAVQIVDNAKQITPPAEKDIYGNAPATIK